jgi:hypothetical protein
MKYLQWSPRPSTNLHPLKDLRYSKTHRLAEINLKKLPKSSDVAEDVLHTDRRAKKKALRTTDLKRIAVQKQEKRVSGRPAKNRGRGETKKVITMSFCIQCCSGDRITMQAGKAKIYLRYTRFER